MAARKRIYPRVPAIQILVASIAISACLLAPGSTGARSVREPPMLQTGTDGAAEDLFAYTAAIRGDTVVVGAPRDDTPAGSWAGSAYAGTLSGSTWTLDATLTHPEPEAIDNFG